MWLNPKVMSNPGNSDRERIVDAIDLVGLIAEHVQLRPKGREHVGLCPFHDDHTPSMHVVTHKGSHFFKCFACGESGSAIDFVMKYHSMPFIEALRYLAERVGIELQTSTRPRDEAERDRGPGRAELIKANEFALQYFQRGLGHPEAGAAARLMIEERGISKEMVERFALGAVADSWDGLATLVRRRGMDLRSFREAGLAKETSSGSGVRDTFVNRLIFPIHDQLGRPIAFGGRVLSPDHEPKYLNSPETRLFEKSKTLFGLHLARHAIAEANSVIVAEGYTDVIALHQAGFPNAVATLGTALTRDHARLLRRNCDTVILLFDGDDAGQKAADRSVEIFFAEAIDIRISIMPHGVDPADLLRDPDEGPDKMRALLDAAVDALTFVVRRMEAEIAGTDSLAGRQKRIEALLARLTNLGFNTMSGIRKRLVLPQLADLLGIRLNELERWIPQPKPRRRDRAGRSVEENNETTAVGAESATDRIRRRAEEDLLSVLLFEPQVGAEHVDVGDGHMLPLAEACPPEAFRDPRCRVVYAVIQPRLECGESFSVPSIQGHLDDEPTRNLVAALYFRGRELCAGVETRASEKLQDVFRALDRVRDREALHVLVDELRAPSPDPAAATAFVRVFEERRQRQDDYAVLPRAARS